MVHAAALTVLLLHGGGWVFGNAAEMDRYRPALPRGAKVISVEYTLCDYRKGLRDIERVARRERRRGRRVLAVGWSAGGGYATALAARRQVDAAVDLAPVIDYPHWGTPLSWHFARVDTLAARRALAPSSFYRRTSAPVRIVQGTADAESDPAPNRQFARRWPQVRIRMIRGAGHVLTAAQVAPTIRAAVRSDLRTSRVRN